MTPTQPPALSEEELSKLARIHSAVAAADGSPVWGPVMKRCLLEYELDPGALIPQLLASARRCASLEARVAELEAENERLRMARIPGEAMYREDDEQ